MTYFGFLLRFLVFPLIILLGLVAYDRRRGRRLPATLQNVPGRAAVLLHVVIAVLYTTPWDNYLVATGVWWYDPELVTGIVLGWVPLEEYIFFVLQTVLTGTWLLLGARWLHADTPEPTQSNGLRRNSTAGVGLLWAGSVAILVAGWQPGTYLGLILVWALPPIMLQLAFGADILWQYRRLVLWSIVPTTLYLSAADVLTIAAGTWTIDPRQSTGVLLAGVLPLEEALFFLMTNTLIGFGITLLLARESRTRFRYWGARVERAT